MSRLRKLLAAVFSSLVLVSCGGGGDGGFTDTGSSGDAGGNTGARVASVELNIGSSELVADGSTVAVVQATVKDSNDDPLASQTISMRTTLGSLTASASPVSSAQVVSVTSGADGIAQAYLRSATTLGQAVLTAEVSGFSQTAAVDFVAGPPASMDVVASPSTVQPLRASAISVTVYDASGNPVSGQKVDFSVNPNNSGGELRAISATTDGNGQASVSYNAGGKSGVADVIRAKAGSVAVSTTLNVDAAAAIVNSVKAVAGSTQLIADAQDWTVIRATVLDTSGAPVSGLPVSFTTTLGAITPSSATTNASGIAEVKLTSVKQVGTASVTASTAGFSSVVAVTFKAGAPATVHVGVPSGAVKPGTSVSISATVQDANGIAVGGETVQFALVSNGSGGSLAGSASATTNDSGIATLSYTIGGTSGAEDVIEAKVKSNGVAGRGTVRTTEQVVAKVGLTTSATSVPSNNTAPATITASVLDASSAAVEGITVQFSATGGKLSASSAVTDVNGDAVVKFSSGNIERSNRVASVTATVGSLAKQLPVQIVGSTITMSAAGKTALSDDGSDLATLTITATDAGGNGVGNAVICLLTESDDGGQLTIENEGSGLPISDICPEGTSHGNLAGNTDPSGQVRLRVSGAHAGRVRVTAYGLGDIQTLDFLISEHAVVFRIEGGETVPTVLVGQPVTITVQAPEATRVIFGTTFGSWDGTSGNTVTAVNVVDGKAIASLRSSKSGVAEIQVRSADNAQQTDTMRAMFSDDVSAAAKIIMAAEPKVLHVSTGGTTYPSTVTAIVLTADNKPVAGAIVSFTTLESTGGGEYLSPPIDVTDSAGVASATFYSGTRDSSNTGIPIQAALPASGAEPSGQLKATTNIVITGTASSIVIGDPTEMTDSEDNTRYISPMAVQVLDAHGNPVADASVTLGIWPTTWRYGTRSEDGYSLVFDEFPNEDQNRNAILDPGEDFDGNGQITPPNAASGSVPLELVTDSNGVAEFSWTYMKEYAHWLSVRMRATTSVSGTEMTQERSFDLAALVVDLPYLDPSPFNDNCPYTVRGPAGTVRIPPGGAMQVPLTLVDPEGWRSVESRPARIWSQTTVSATEGVTDAGGNFTSTISAATDAVPGTVGKVSFSVSCGWVDVNVLVGAPPSLSVSGPLAVVSDSTVPIKFKLVDGNGVPVAGAAIDLKLLSTSGGSLVDTSGTTDATGSFQTNYTSGLSQGIDTITAFSNVDGNTVAVVHSINVSTVGGISVTTAGATMTVGGLVPVRVAATVVNSTGASLPDVPVTFQTDLGLFDTDGDNRGDAQEVGPIIASKEGVAEAFLFSSDEAGTATVTAQARGYSDHTSVQFTPDAPFTVQVTAVADTVVAGEQTVIAVVVLDRYGNPIPNELLYFGIEPNSSGGSLDLPSATTDVRGRAAVTYTAGNLWGETDTIAVVVARNGKFDIADIEVATPPVGSIEVAALNSKLVADGAATTSVRATVKDRKGSVIIGLPVSFTDRSPSSLGTAVTPGCADTDPTGVAETLLRAGKKKGIATVEASAGGYSATTTVELQAGAPSQITVTAAPDPVNPHGAVTLTAEVLDEYGNTVVNEPVDFLVSENNSGGNLEDETDTTDLAGRAVVIYTAGAIAEKTDTIRVTTRSGVIGTGEVNVSSSETIVKSIALTAGAQEIPADNKSTTRIRALVIDRNDHAASGVNVSFKTTLGTIVDPTTGEVIAGPVKTGADGYADVDLKAGTESGPVIVTATAGGFVDTVDVTFKPRPRYLSIHTDQIKVQSSNADRAAISVSVLDENRAGIGGVRVSLRADYGQLSTPSVETDADGNATVYFSSGTIDRSNRLATVTAKATDIDSPVIVPIHISGTSLVLSMAVTSLIANDEDLNGNGKQDAGEDLNSDGVFDSIPAQVEVTATDASGAAIYNALVCLQQTAITGSVRLIVSGALAHPEEYGCAGGVAVMTDVNGRLSAVVIGNDAGLAVNVTASGLGTGAGQDFTVTDITETFRIISPDKVPVPTVTTDRSAELAVTARAPTSRGVIFATSLGWWAGTDDNGYEDINRNGILETSEDTDGDGRLDMNEDENGNRLLDYDEDKDGDGKLDMGEDANLNGILDPGEDKNGNDNLDLYEDLDADGRLDVDEDTDGDGHLDIDEDANGNGKLDLGEDSDGDGHLDIDEDFNGDGNLDVDEDKNNNGERDPDELDVDGDNVLDVVDEDIDDDGHLDIDEDVNRNGILDQSEDLDRDGHLDVKEDIDGDGRLDISEDFDGDGNIDVAEDVDGDDILDTVDEDKNGNGRLDLGAPYLRLGVDEDLDGDGLLDAGEDINCNGLLDVGEDVNGNGLLDVGEDVDCDGLLDVNEDTNDNGVLDAGEVDLNRNGELDSVVKTAKLKSAMGGKASVSVVDVDKSDLSDSLAVAFSRPVADAFRLILQASPADLGVSEGSSRQTSRVEARVLTADDQPVADAPINFVITDPTGSGETLSPVFAYTDISGLAWTTFVSGSGPSDAQGVTIEATLLSKPTVRGTTSVVVAEQAGSVVVGASTVVESSDDETQYTLPMAVMVTNASGSPVAGAIVSLSAWPTQYRTGYWVYDTGLNEWVPYPTGFFINEDRNENLIFDADDVINIIREAENEDTIVPNGRLDAGEDINGNGKLDVTEDIDRDGHLDYDEDVNGVWYDYDDDGHIDVDEDINGNWVLDDFVDLNGDGALNGPYDDRALTPHNSVAGSVPMTVVTDANGTASFDLQYLKNYSVWVRTRIRASVFAQGTEAVGDYETWLPYAKKDNALLSKSPFFP